MAHSTDRRQFLAGSLTATVALGTGTQLASANDEKVAQEYYELRTYQIPSSEKQAVVHDYLESALIPALRRQRIDRVGVFTQLDKPADVSIFVLIPYPTLDAVGNRNAQLESDKAYQQAAAKLFSLPKSDPAYTRINSRFMKAFSGMPVIELPETTAAKQPRIFELRTYESHNEEKAALKVDMFNAGEIDIMRDVKMAPVFYGEMLIGDDVPNLTYMLSATDMDAHEEHWKGFLSHPEWDRMNKLAKYKDTVSKITKWYLQPTPYSHI
ncbi:MAG: NIPSNAP family containing protein [Planctomycetaceae bacterium]|nr:NIPSNAP family containing protein [Planctomycetaceae bacterium]